MNCVYSWYIFIHRMTTEHYSTTEDFLQQIADKLAEIRNRA